MKKGTILLLSAFALLAVSLVLIYLYERPATVGQAYTSPTVDCGSNMTCVASAMHERCRQVNFQLLGESGDVVFTGIVRGMAASKCEVVIEYPPTGEKMTCYLSEPPASGFISLGQYASSCSGELADKVAI